MATLAPGTRLGPYEITAKLGEGGMGQVFQAKDFHLGRNVALKVLPEEFSTNAERLARFEREAKLLAQLNHPNIAQIYGLETSGDTRALVMELVEGLTLAERLEAGPLPFNESLSVSLQIALALEEAHEKGIVHRDLKPQNIKASVEGKVKVLDFGLAKAMDPAGHSAALAADLAHSPTVTFGGTREGVILGTAAYMAPEQARGAMADKRADIWAFGVVLYEMLAGERLFAEGSVVDTLSAVMRKKIDLDPLPVSTPARLRELIGRCLERDPRRRLRDIGEARLVLSDLLQLGPDAGAEPPRPAERASPSSWLGFVAGAVATAAAIFAWSSFFPRAASKGIDAPALPSSFLQVTDSAGIESSPALAPDGKSVVFVAGLPGNRDLYLLRVGGRNAVALTADYAGDDWQPAFSPDGQRIAFRSEREDGGIFFMEATGESVRRLTDSGFDPSWSPDGRQVAFTRTVVVTPTDLPVTGSGIHAVDLDSRAVRQIAGGDVAQAAWSPHGNRIAFWGVSRGGRRDLFTILADGSEASTGGVAVTDDAALDWGPLWSPDGRYLYFGSDRGGAMNLWRVGIDERSGERRGEPEPVTTPSLWSGRPSFSRDGSRLAYATLDWRSRLMRVDFDPEAGRPTSEPRLLLANTRPIRDHEVSPDGAAIVYVQMGERDDLFVVDPTGGTPRALTDDPFRDRRPAWSPDGRRLAFFSDRSGDYEIWTMRADGSGLEPWTDFKSGCFNPVWSPDGRRMAVTLRGQRQGWRILDASSQQLPKPYVEGPPVPGEPGRFQPWAWSRDGSAIAGFQVHPDGTMGDVYVYRLADERFTSVGGTRPSFWRAPVWLNDSKRLLVRDDRWISVVDVASKTWTPLLEVGGYVFSASVGISPDNRWITYTETATEGDIWVAELGKAAAERP
jgi:Tol biopolymer transport system component